LITAARGSATTQYAGHMIYEGTTLKRILVDGGYIEGSTYRPYAYCLNQPVVKPK
jgi:hypothetical protein